MLHKSTREETSLRSKDAHFDHTCDNVYRGAYMPEDNFFNRRHRRGRVRSTDASQKTVHIVPSAKGTGAPQLSSLSSDCRRQLIWRESGTAYRPEKYPGKLPISDISIMVWAGIKINGRTRLHVVANGTMMGQRYINEVLLPHVRLFRGACGDKFVLWTTTQHVIEHVAVQDCQDSEVAGRNYPPTNKNTLIRALTEEWDKLPQQLLDNVVQSMNIFHMTTTTGENTFQTSDKSSNMSGCMEDTSLRIASFSSDRLDGPDRYTRDFKYPHNQKSAGVKSGNRGGHGTCGAC
ncbi:uncharacterized protein TNCV_4151121 [Trichonephila clavipes]|nr:uncharacterized protein TNCV_4151121 [Trichonephila clavipes]